MRAGVALVVGVWALVGAAGCGDNIHPTINVASDRVDLPLGATDTEKVELGGYTSGTAVATFTIDDESIASVHGDEDNSAIVITGLKIGTTTAHAEYMGEIDDVTIQVWPATMASLTVTPSHLALPVGLGGTFEAVAIFTDGTQHDVSTDAAWSSDDASVASPSAGIVAAITAGDTELHATYQGATADASVTVTAALVISLEVTPSTITLPLGTQQHLTATAVYSDHTTHDVTATAVWTSDSAPIATVAAGTVGATGAGSTDVHATFGAASAASHVTVNGATMVAIEIDPPVLTLPVGATRTAVATAHFADGSTHDVTGQVAWASDNTHVTVAGGAIKGDAAGLAHVTATLSSLAGHALVTITPATLLRVELSETTVSMPVHASHQLDAVAVYSDNTTLDVTGQALWTSDAPLTAGVLFGNVSSLLAGSAKITATLGLASASAAVTVTAATLASLEVSPATVSVPTAMTTQLTATGHYSDGTSADLTASVLWTTDAPLTATVSNALSHGVVTGLLAGTAHVTATLGTQSAASTVTVTAATVASVGCDPASITVGVGLTASLHATAVYSDGTTKDVSALASWSSSASSIASVSLLGLVTGQTAGSATISVKLGATTGTCAVTVSAATLDSITVDVPSPTLPVGSTEQLVATGHYSDGTARDLTSAVLWTSDLHVVVTNVLTHGVATGLLAGPGTVTATLGLTSGTAAISVTGATLARIELSDLVAIVATGGQRQITATAIYSDGTSADVTQSATWSANTASASVVKGLVTGVSLGGATVTATRDGQTAAAVVTVTAASVSSLDVAPAAISIPLATTAALTATAHYSDGTTADVTTQALWTTDAPLTAPVSNVLTHGVVTGLLAGTAHVSAALGGKTTSATVTVSSAVVTQLQITPAALTLARGSTGQLTATAVYSDGSTRDVSSEAAWTAIGTATVSSKGLVTAQLVGGAVITAQLGATVATASITVTAATLSSLRIEPSSLTLARGLTSQLSAMGTYSDMSVVDLTASATWSSSAPAQASVSKGKVTANAFGAATVTAQLAGVTATAAVTITDAQLVGIGVAPTSLSIPRGTTGTFAVTGTYTDGSTADITATSSITSQNAAIASAVGGVVTANGTGSTTIDIVNGEMHATVPVTVTAAQLLSLAVSPGSVGLPKGLYLPIVLLGTYSDGTTVDVTSTASFTSDAVAIASVSNVSGTIGMIHALAVGKAVITARIGTLTATVTVDVSGALLQGIAVNVGVGNLLIAEVRVFTATGTYSDGTTQDLTAAVSWASSAPSILSVSNLVGSQGKAIALLGGTSTITAVLAGTVGSAPAMVGSGGCHPVINEVSTGSVTSSKDEYLELYNPCTATFDLTFDALVFRTAVLGSVDQPLVTLSGSLAPGQYLLFANSGYTGTKNGSFTYDLPPLGGGIALRTASVVIDSLGYGAGINTYVEGVGAVASLLGASVARTPNGKDTDNNVVDFAAANRTPRAAN